MYRTAIIVLKNITTLIKSGNSDVTNSFDYLLNFSVPSEQAFYDALDQLKDENLITYTNISSDTEVIEDIALTPSGRTYPERHRRELVKIFMTSIACPVIVAFITTMITLLLNRAITV